MFGSLRSLFRNKQRRALLQDKFGAPVAAGALNATPATPGPSGNRVATDTESKMAVMPWHSNSATALATQATMSATFGTPNNRCSFYAGQSWIGFEGADFGAIGLETGRWYLVRMFDSSSRMAYCYIQGGNLGSGETLGSELVTDLANTSFETYEYSGNQVTSAINTEGTGRAGQLLATAGGKLYKGVWDFVVNSITGNLYGRFASSATYGSGYFWTSVPITTTGAAQRVQYSVYTPVVYPSMYAAFSIATDGLVDCSVTVSAKEVTAPAATCAYAYSSPNGTQGWVMDGNFNMNDTAYTYSIFELSGTKLVCAGGKATAAQGEPYDGYPVITRALGRTLLIGPVTIPDVTKIVEFGLDHTNQTGQLAADCVHIESDLVKLYDGGSAGPAVLVPADSSSYYFAVRLLSAGAEVYYRTLTGAWKLLWRGGSNNTSALYPGISGNTAAFWLDQIKIPPDLWNPPCLLYDSFTRSDGAIGSSESVDSDGVSAPVRAWSGAGAAVSGNALCITPTLGAELVPNCDMELDSIWASYSSPTVNERSSEQAYSGSYSRKLVEDTDGVSGIRHDANPFALTSDQIYFTSYKVYPSIAYFTLSVRKGDDSGYDASFLSNNTLSINQWNSVVFSWRATVSGSSGYALAWTNTRVGTFYLDDISIKQITLSSTLALSNIGTADALIMGAAGAFTSGTQLGWAIGVDDPANPQNGLFAYVDGTYVYLDIMVAGVWTNKVKATTAYVAGVLPIIVRDGTYVAVYYNGALQGSTVTLSAGENTATRGLYAGGFSTYASNLIADILIKPRGTANEYGSLSQYER